MFGLSFIDPAAATHESERVLAMALNTAVLPLGVVCLFYGLITERTRLSHILGSSMAQYLGKSSYAFYLVHLGVLSTVVQRYLSAEPLVLFVLVVVVSLGLWKFIEEPCQRWLRAKPAPAPASIAML
jgi:peptidoglycan/LPS O-acetylase OafA/YrhL